MRRVRAFFASNSVQSGADPSGCIAYLCLQATREGQASHAHVHEIICGLRARGWGIQLLEPHYAGSARQPGLFAKLWAFFSVQWRLWLKFRSWQALYIRAHPAAFPTAIIAWMLKIPVIQEINGPYHELFTMFPKARMLRPLIAATAMIPLRIATSLIVVTPQLREYVDQHIGSRPANVIPNGANTGAFCPAAPRRLDLPKRYVVFFGALAKWQGLADLLAAVSGPEWPTGISLVIAGAGSEQDAVVKAAAQNPEIIYLGRVPYSEMPGLIAHSIAGLSPKNNVSGHRDTGLSPLKMYETLACGVPVIVTDFPGPAELVHLHHCGLVIPEGSPKAIADAVAYLCSHPDEARAMGKRGRDAVVHSHSWDRRAADTDAVLCSVLGRHGRE